MAQHKTRPPRDPATPPADCRVGSRPLSAAPDSLLAAELSECVGNDGLILAASSNARAEQVAAAARVLDPELSVCLMPGWDCLPFDRVSPSPAVMGMRMAALLRLRVAGRHLLVAPIETLMQRLPAPDGIAPLRLAPGDDGSVDALAARLHEMGYGRDEQVDMPGEVAFRGAVVDIFPADATLPARLRLEHGRIAEIDVYDPSTQRSVRQLEALSVGPASELVLQGPDDRFPGLEHFLPERVARLVTVFDLLPAAALLLDRGADELLADRFAQIAEARQTRLALRGDAAPALPPASLYLTKAEWHSACAGRRVMRLEDRTGDALPNFGAASEPAEACAAFVTEQARQGRRVGLVGRRLVQAMAEALEQTPVHCASWRDLAAARAGTVAILPDRLDTGFVADAAVVIASGDVFGPAADRAGGSAWPSPSLRPGDAVVDLDHGLAVLRGLQTLDADGAPADCLALEFAGGARLLVPVEDAGRIWRYGGEADAVALDRVEGDAWTGRRGTIEQEIAATARGLVQLASQRAGQAAQRYAPPRAALLRFAAGFPYAPTWDQTAAIAAVLEDLASGRSMDRLLCGDVGFGKTEVALRAAAAVALAGGQVAVVAPTTVLVRQHLETFRRRFAPLGVRVAALSRLTPSGEARQIRAGLADGSIGVVIGTQMLAGPEVRYAGLGLVVIDEEHRFGLRQKAMLRRLREGVHTLTLTATPIPRTLQGALGGLQELSVLATPPARRQPVRTVAMAFDPATARSALVRERRRGGQSFVVCPRIEDIAPVASLLRELIPELDIIEAHGGLAPDRLDRALLDFAGGAGDVLLATNIVEAGLDIPRANTMLVWNADRFGMAQLHQLRGRVGRGRARGLVWLFTDPDRGTTAAAARRLRTLETLDRPGAGFAIAARDLDLRGAGDLLGEEQAGHVRLIGMELYQHLLSRALRVAKGQPVAADWKPDVALGIARHLPPDYVPDEALRIALHMRLARLEEPGALAEELEDRFGALPGEVVSLLVLTRLRRACRQLGVARLDGGPAGIAATFRDEPPTVAGLERHDDRLLLRQPSRTDAERLSAAASLLRALRQQGSS